MKIDLGRIARRAVTAVFVAGAPVLASAETLHDALIGAYTHSGLLDQNRALLRAADEDVAQAAAALRPIINWSFSVTQSNTNFNSVRNRPLNQSTFGTRATLAVVGELLLYDGGRTKLGVAAARETVLATRQSLISVEQQVLQRAVNAYFNVRRQAENVALFQSNLRLITQELRAARDRFEVGEVTRTDVSQAEARLAEARSGLAAAQGALVTAQEQYTAVVGRRPGQLAAPRGLPRLEGNVARAKDIAVRQHPDLRAVQHSVKAADINVQRADLAKVPTIKLEGGISQTEEFNSYEYSENVDIGINLSGPIYQGGALASSKRQAIANRDAQRGNLHNVRHTIRQNVGIAYADLQVANAQLTATDEGIRAARVAFRGVREEATLGARTTLDVLNAEQALLDAQASRISAEADRYIAAYAVLAAMGQLTVEALNLNVPRYDPDAYYNLVKDAPTETSKQGQKLDRVLRALQKD